MTICLCFCIFLLLWFDLLFGTRWRPMRLKFFYKQEAVGGHRGEGSDKGRATGSSSITVPPLLWYYSFLKGNRCRTRKGIKFRVQRLIINLAEDSVPTKPGDPLLCNGTMLPLGSPIHDWAWTISSFSCFFFHFEHFEVKFTYTHTDFVCIIQCFLGYSQIHANITTNSRTFLSSPKETPYLPALIARFLHTQPWVSERSRSVVPDSLWPHGL